MFVATNIYMYIIALTKPIVMVSTVLISTELNLLIKIQ